jgi:anti-anti-sigma factor
MLFDIAKLLLDKETRESFKEVVAFVKKRPEWKADLVEMNERFGSHDEHNARIFVQFSVELLAQKGWQPGRVGVAEFAIQELVDNAFTHGLRRRESDGKVRISTVLSSSWIRCSVEDNGEGFALADVLNEQSAGEERGLAKVKAIATKLTQLDRNTITVTIASVPGKVTLSEQNRVCVIALTGEFRRNDYSDIATNVPQSIPTGAKVVLDLTKMSYANSMALRLFMNLQRQLTEKSCQIVVVIDPNSRMKEIFEISRFYNLFLCVDTLEQAFKHCDVNKSEDKIDSFLYEI